MSISHRESVDMVLWKQLYNYIHINDLFLGLCFHNASQFWIRGCRKDCINETIGVDGKVGLVGRIQFQLACVA